MAQHHYSHQAAEDINAIGDYIAIDSPDAADRVIDRIDERCKLLALNPHSGTSVENFQEDLRAVSVGVYAIFYLPLQGEAGIRVARILHGARVLPAAFHREVNDSE